MRTCILILDNVRSVENVGSIFRTAEGLGVSKIILTGITPTPLDRFGRRRRDLSKVALGAEDTIDWEFVKDPTEIVQKLKSDGFEIVALEQSPQSKDLKQIKSSSKFALIVGSEVGGISPELMVHTDEILEIPMLGKKESLNVSVATGIALFMLI